MCCNGERWGEIVVLGKKKYTKRRNTTKTNWQYKKRLFVGNKASQLSTTSKDNQQVAFQQFQCAVQPCNVTRIARGDDIAKPALPIAPHSSKEEIVVVLIKIRCQDQFAPLISWLTACWFQSSDHFQQSASSRTIRSRPVPQYLSFVSLCGKSRQGVQSDPHQHRRRQRQKHSY